jgi:outer membrane protein insertion porin family
VKRKNNTLRFRRVLLGLTALACAAQLGAAELKVTGLGWLNNRAAEQKLKLLLGKGAVGDLGAHALEDAALILISELNSEGYLEPVLTVEATQPDGQVVRHVLDARLEPQLPRSLSASAATLQLEKGPRSTLSDVTFDGLLAMPEKDARSYFIGENTLIPLATDRIYSPDRLHSSAGNLEEALRQLGYAEAEVIPGEVQPDPKGNGVRVGIEVHEGRRGLVTGLQFAIADGSEAPVELAGPRMGKPWTSLWRVDTATAIRGWYYARGHPDVQIRLVAQAAPAADGTNAITVTAEITPGPEVRVGEIRFDGRIHSRDATLRRFVRVTPGELLNPILFNDGQAQISRLGVFRTVDLRYEPEGATTRDVVYEVVEGRRQEVSLLAGYGSYEQLRGGVEWRHYNLFGRAHRDSLKVVQSMKSSSADYTYTVPALFGNFTDGSARLFGWRREEFSFVNEEYGANFSVAWPLRGLGLQLTTGYTYKHTRVADSELASQATDPEQVDIASLDLGVVRERRDNPLQPRKGYKLYLQAELASQALGGEVDYQQIVFGGSYHTAWGKGRWVHLAFAQGTVFTLGAPDDTALPVAVRFYPGGDSSIRGYQKGEAAPRNAEGLFVGAKTYLQMNVDLEQALTPKWSAVVFFDALGTSMTLENYPFEEELYSVGLGLRYQTIIGPVRLEYGYNLNPRPLDPAGTLLLSIGYPF